MKALRYHAVGGPEVLQVDEVPLPSPAPGEARVRVHVAGVNFADTERRRGLYDAAVPLPRTLGSEAAGVVDAVGEGVDAGLLGQRVVLWGQRCCAEWTCARAEALWPVPAGVTLAQAAALPVQGLTAWHLLHTVGRVQRGDAVLVHAAAGGVGTLLVQLARAAGARVLAVVGSAEKAARAQSLGADVVLRSDLLLRDEAQAPLTARSDAAGAPETAAAVVTQADAAASPGPDAAVASRTDAVAAPRADAAVASEVHTVRGAALVAAVRAATDGRGVQLALDSVGRATWEASVRALAPFGHAVSYGSASGAPGPVDVDAQLFAHSLKVSAYWLMTPHAPGAHAAAMQALLAQVAAGTLKPVLGLQLPLAEAAEAHRQLEGRQTAGKVLLRVREG
jgi:NADPH2:quinone reductase